jgi:ectoine hydroxylase-related dioxygenase (phytanoyl-CoA dioxygenase family)
MSDDLLTSAQIERFEREGYLILDRLFDDEEMDLLLKIGKADRAMADEARNRRDGQGCVSRISLRNDLGEDIYSAIVRSERIVRRMERLLDGEVYHWHHKMMLKEPRVGGAWEWHQDYGYWYQYNYCLYPHMASCMIAVDRATRENGCLQVIPGSHEMGRIDHVKIGDQTGVDPERMAAILERLPVVHVELEPGSAVIFHSNLLHCSAANSSEHARWSLICCYNAARNDPYRESQHPRYTPLEVRPDERVREIGRRQWSEIQQETASSESC